MRKEEGGELRLSVELYGIVHYPFFFCFYNFAAY